MLSNPSVANFLNSPNFLTFKSFPHRPANPLLSGQAQEADAWPSSLRKIPLGLLVIDDIPSNPPGSQRLILCSS